MCRSSSLAHPPDWATPSKIELLFSWTWDPAVAFGLLCSALVYTAGAVRVWRRAGVFQGVRSWHVTSFATGWLTLVVALLSPLDVMSDWLFSAHMVQHELLMLVAAPLIVAGRPLLPMLWGLPAARRDRLARWLRQPGNARWWATITAPWTVLVLHALAIWVWHVPMLFQAALENEIVHTLQHVMFFATAALFWWAMIHGRYGRAGYGLSVLFVFATALHTSILGALLSFGQRLWYPGSAPLAETFGLSPLEDQQLAGLLMWVPSGFVFVVTAVALFAAWLGVAEQRMAYRQRTNL